MTFQQKKDMLNKLSCQQIVTDQQVALSVANLIKGLDRWMDKVWEA